MKLIIAFLLTTTLIITTSSQASCADDCDQFCIDNLGLGWRGVSTSHDLPLPGDTVIGECSCYFKVVEPTTPPFQIQEDPSPDRYIDKFSPAWSQGALGG
jgi:hypothetical protein